MVLSKIPPDDIPYVSSLINLKQQIDRSTIPSNQLTLRGPQQLQDRYLMPVQLYHGLHLHTTEFG